MPFRHDSFKMTFLLFVYLASTLQAVAALPFIKSESWRLVQSLLPRQSTASNFTDSNFVRLAFHSSIVLGNTLYIDGGEISSTDDGDFNMQVPNNDTLSIDLSQSWSPSDVTFNAIPKGDNVPNLVWESLWSAPDNKSFYLWAGAVSRSLPDAADRNPPHGLWQFKDGAWSQVELNSGSIFPSLNRPVAGLSTYGNGVGYYLGGYDSDINPSVSGPFVPSPGLISYNMTSNTWKNASSLGYDYDGTAYFGGMEYLPMFGSEGLLVSFGGDLSSPTTWFENGEDMQSFTNISIYDPSGSGQWYSQQATGHNGQDDIPHASDMFCTVGVQSDAGTYEIFMYGGHNDAYINGGSFPDASTQAAQAFFNKVYVLSLPGFVWFKVNDTSAKPRTGHTCELVGNRQMLSIGGLDPSNHSIVNYTDPDTNPQGLGIFDMVQLNWTNTYDANAAPYTAPDVVKEWYSRPNSNSSVQWSSPQLKNLFSHMSTPSSPGTTPPSSSAPASPASASSPNAGAIAGVVVGCVVGVTLIAAAAWFFVRREWQRGHPLSSSELPASGSGAKRALGADEYPPEKPVGGKLYSEMPVRHEMDNQSVAQELASPIETPRQELASPIEYPLQELESPTYSRGHTYELG